MTSKTNNRLQRAKETKEFLKKIVDFKNSLAEVEISDIDLSSERGHNYITFKTGFPEVIYTNYRLIVSTIEQQQEDSELYKLYYYAFFGNFESKYNELDIRIQILDEDNRIHVTQAGLPPGFRNLGLGKKLYKRVLKEVGYFTSYECDSFGQCDNSLESDLVWESLTRESDIKCDFNDNKIIACYAVDEAKYSEKIFTYLQ